MYTLVTEQVGNCIQVRESETSAPRLMNKWEGTGRQASRGEKKGGRKAFERHFKEVHFSGMKKRKHEKGNEAIL